MAKYKVLSTKKLLPSLVEQAKQNDIEIIEQDFISVKPILNRETFENILSFALNDKRVVVLTSSNAVEVLERYMQFEGSACLIDWQVFCLSGKTKETLLNAHRIEKNILGEAKNAEELSNEIIRHGVKEIVFFCGDKRRDELPTILKAAGIKVHEVVMYETTETPAVATEDIDAIFFFSPSAVQSFFSVNQLKKNTVCFAIGQTTANKIADFTDNQIIISESPSQEMMLASVQFYFQHRECFE
jgi:uroporphyrinogen-III synthase